MTGDKQDTRNLTTVRELVLDTAKGYVLKDRNSQYDTPERNFEMIAELWMAYTGQTFAPHDVAAMMIMVKLARITTSPAVLDHWVDVAGYAACGAETRPGRDEQPTSEGE